MTFAITPMPSFSKQIWVVPPLNPSKVFSDPPFCSPKNQVIPPKILRTPPPPFFARLWFIFVCILLLFFDRPRSHRVYTKTYSGSEYKWGLYLTIILDNYWGHWATKPDFRFITKSIAFDFPWIYSFNFAKIQTIKYNRKILNIKPNAGTVQGRYSIIFKRLMTDRQHTCNSVDKWVSIAFRLPQLHHYIPSWLNFYLFHL